MHNRCVVQWASGVVMEIAVVLVQPQKTTKLTMEKLKKKKKVDKS